MENQDNYEYLIEVKSIDELDKLIEKLKQEVKETIDNSKEIWE